METVPVTHGERCDEFATLPGYDQLTVTALELSRQGIHQGGVVFKQGLPVKEVGTKIEDGVILAEGEIVKGTRVLNRHCFAISQALAPKTVEIEVWRVGIKEDGKV